MEYARIFDGNEGPQGTFRQVPTFMPLGRSWYIFPPFFRCEFQSFSQSYLRYPTASLLADGRVMVTGAYSDHHTDTCYEARVLLSELHCFTRGAYGVTRHTSHVTRHTSHVTRHTSHINASHQTSHFHSQHASTLKSTSSILVPQTSSKIPPTLGSCSSTRACMTSHRSSTLEYVNTHVFLLCPNRF